MTGGRYIETEDAYVQQNRVNVVPQVSGQIAARRASARTRSSPPARRCSALDDATYRSAVEAAEARLASARLEVERLKAAFAQAVAEAATARESLATTRTQDERQQALLASGVVSQSAADDSALKLQLASGAVVKAESAVVLGPRRPRRRPRDRDRPPPAGARGARRAARGRARPRPHHVTAPAAGIVSQTDRLQVGQYVTPAVPVLSLVATGATWIEANYKETDLTHMRRASR